MVPAEEDKCKQIEVLTKAMNEMNKLITRLQKQEEYELTSERSKQIDKLIEDAMKISQKIMKLL